MWLSIQQFSLYKNDKKIINPKTPGKTYNNHDGHSRVVKLTGVYGGLQGAVTWQNNLSDYPGNAKQKKLVILINRVSLITKIWSQ